MNQGVSHLASKGAVGSTVLIFLTFSFVFPQQQSSTAGRREIATLSATVSFAEIAQEELLAVAAPTKPKSIPFMPLPSNLAVPEEAAQSVLYISPTAPETAVLAMSSPDLSSSFPALEDNNTAIPPDTQGAVGPAHLMVTPNTQVRIQSRSGSTLHTVSLNAFWADLDNPDTFDPKVLYDPYGQRWIFIACGDSESPTSSVLIGVSQSDDLPVTGIYVASMLIRKTRFGLIFQALDLTKTGS